AAEFERSVGLGVPGVEVGWPTPEPEQDHGSGGRGRGRPGCRPQAEQVGHGQSQDRTGTRFQEGTPSQALAGARVLLAEQKHGRSLPPSGWTAREYTTAWWCDLAILLLPPCGPFGPSLYSFGYNGLCRPAS